MYRLFYRPEDGAAADVIPFFENGRYRLFYLKDYRNPEKYGEGTPWFQIETSDFIEYEDLGEAIERGTESEQDLYVFTGSIIKASGQYHIFYTGNNHNMRYKESVMHAVSADAVHWEKIREDMFFADAQQFDPDNFRDPFVFYNEKSGKYNMLLVSRKQNSPYSSGFTALYVSDDLKSWEYEREFWAPQLYHTHECPDLFKMGDRYYLIFSEYSDENKTRYVMSESPDGPWRIPCDDCFDGRAFYAAKSCGDGNRRFLFGWIPTKEKNDDKKGWQWGGNIAVHELVQREDGTLAVKIPESTAQAGKLFAAAADGVLSCPDGKAEKLVFENVPDSFRITGKIAFDGNTASFGINIGYSFRDKTGYKYEILPRENRLRFNSLPYNGFEGQGLERVMYYKESNTVEFTLLADGDICVIYINGEIALSSRMYSVKGRDISLFAVGGRTEYRDLTLYEI